MILLDASDCFSLDAGLCGCRERWRRCFSALRMDLKDYRICVHSHLSVEGGCCCSSFSGFGVEMFRLTECENLGV